MNVAVIRSLQLQRRAVAVRNPHSRSVHSLVISDRSTRKRVPPRAAAEEFRPTIAIPQIDAGREDDGPEHTRADAQGRKHFYSLLIGQRYAHAAGYSKVTEPFSRRCYGLHDGNEVRISLRCQSRALATGSDASVPSPNLRRRRNRSRDLPPKRPTRPRPLRQRNRQPASSNAAADATFRPPGPSHPNELFPDPWHQVDCVDPRALLYKQETLPKEFERLSKEYRQIWWGPDGGPSAKAFPKSPELLPCAALMNGIQAAMKFEYPSIPEMRHMYREHGQNGGGDSNSTGNVLDAFVERLEESQAIYFELFDTCRDLIKLIIHVPYAAPTDNVDLVSSLWMKRYGPDILPKLLVLWNQMFIQRKTVSKKCRWNGDWKYIVTYEDERTLSEGDNDEPTQTLAPLPTPPASISWADWMKQLVFGGSANVEQNSSPDCIAVNDADDCYPSRFQFTPLSHWNIRLLAVDYLHLRAPGLRRVVRSKDANPLFVSLPHEHEWEPWSNDLDENDEDDKAKGNMDDNIQRLLARRAFDMKHAIEAMYSELSPPPQAPISVITAFGDIGLLEHARLAKVIFQSYPAHFDQLFWRVLCAFQNATVHEDNPENAAKAALEAFQLIRQFHAQLAKSEADVYSVSTPAFCSSIGIQCLAAVDPIVYDQIVAWENTNSIATVTETLADTRECSKVKTYAETLDQLEHWRFHPSQVKRIRTEHARRRSSKASYWALILNDADEAKSVAHMAIALARLDLPRAKLYLRQLIRHEHIIITDTATDANCALHISVFDAVLSSMARSMAKKQANEIVDESSQGKKTSPKDDHDETSSGDDASTTEGTRNEPPPKESFAVSENSDFSTCLEFLDIILNNPFLLLEPTPTTIRALFDTATTGLEADMMLDMIEARYYYLKTVRLRRRHRWQATPRQQAILALAYQSALRVWARTAIPGACDRAIQITEKARELGVNEELHHALASKVCEGSSDARAQEIENQLRRLRSS